MGSGVRIVLSGIIAVGVTVALFYFMSYLVLTGEMVVSGPQEAVRIRFHQSVPDTRLQTKQRQVPEEPPPPKNPPERPKMQTKTVTKMTSPLPTLDVPNLDVSYTGTGAYLPSQLGSGAGGFARSGTLIPLVRVPPRYPRRARVAGIEGYVTVAFTITPRGTVTNVSVVKAEPPRVFNAAAIDAILKWEFKPKVVNGRRVSQRARQTITFSLGGN